MANPPAAAPRYFTISEAAKMARAKPHIIRYWEKKIPQLAEAAKRRNGRRYYSADDIALLQRIRAMLEDGGYTIDGAAAKLANRPRSADKMAQLRRDIEKVVAVL